MNETYKIIKKLVETNGNKQRAIVKTGCSTRHMNRLIKDYREHGKGFFVHGNRGKKSDAAIDQETRRSIVELYSTKYYDANFTQFAEFLEDKEEIKVSRTSIISMLREQHSSLPKLIVVQKRHIIKRTKVYILILTFTLHSCVHSYVFF